MRGLEARPDTAPLSSSIKQVKEAGRFSNARLGEGIGVSEASVWKYINGKLAPSIDIIGNVFFLIQSSPKIPDAIRDELGERLTQAMVPQVVFAHEFAKTHPNGANVLEQGIKSRASDYYNSQEKNWGVNNPNSRRKLSRTKTRIKTADTPDARLVEALLQDGSYASIGDIAAKTGVSRQTIYHLRVGRHKASPQLQIRLLELLNGTSEV